MQKSTSQLTIDLSAIYNNVKKITGRFGQMMVMVKANGYGTDPVFLAKFLQLNAMNGIPFLGVSHVAEGVCLRAQGVKFPIFVISVPPHEAETAIIHHLTPAVSTFEEVEVLNNTAKKYGIRVPVHLHLNTGMNRFGVSGQEAFAFYSCIKEASHLELEGVMTHFVAAETAAFDSYTEGQIHQFKEFVSLMNPRPRWIHAANSGGAVRFHLPFCNLVRMGLGYLGYGVCLEGSVPALSLATTLSSISYGQKGENVGYNRTYTIQKERERIGVIPFGYHDGFPRSLSGKGYVLIRGKKAPMIGAICMDFMMIDLTEIPEACVGDEVLLFGPELSLETVASWAETDVREILVGIAPRVKRFWMNPPVTQLLLPKCGDNNDSERLPDSVYSLEKDQATR